METWLKDSVEGKKEYLITSIDWDSYLAAWTKSIIGYNLEHEDVIRMQDGAGGVDLVIVVYGHI